MSSFINVYLLNIFPFGIERKRWKFQVSAQKCPFAPFEDFRSKNLFDDKIRVFQVLKLVDGAIYISNEDPAVLRDFDSFYFEVSLTDVVS